MSCPFLLGKRNKIASPASQARNDRHFRIALVDAHPASLRGLRSKPKQSVFIVLFFLFCLAACASKPAANDSFQSNLTLFYTHDREGQTKSCGCTLNPLGGIEREKKYLAQQDPSSSIQLTGGTSFLIAQGKTAPGQLTPVAPPEMIQSLNTLDLAVLSPSALDLKLGYKTLVELKKNAKFPFVSTNILQKKSKEPVFEASTLIKRKDISVLVLGLTTASRQTPAEFEIENPAKALQRYFEKNPVVAGQLTVLISSLSRQERTEIQNRFPQIHLILGGEGEKTYEVDQASASTLYFNPPNMGRAIAKIEFQYRSDSKTFFNPSTALYHRVSVSAWKEKLENIEAHLKSPKLPPNQKSFLTHDKAKYEGLLKRSESVPTEFALGMSEYRSQVIFLDRRFD